LNAGTFEKLNKAESLECKFLLTCRSGGTRCCQWCCYSTVVPFGSIPVTEVSKCLQNITQQSFTDKTLQLQNV